MAIRFGLRARVAANLAAAVSITFGLGAVTTLVVLQRTLVDELRQGAEQATEALAAAAASCVDPACVRGVVAGARGTGLRVDLVDGGCAPCTYVGTASDQDDRRLVVERRAAAGTLRAAFPLAPMADRLRQAAAQLVALLVLNGVVLIVVAALLLERSVVRRLGGVGQALERVEALDLETPLLIPEGSDEIGRVEATVRRMTEKLRDERRRRDAYIEELERANRALSETREGLARSERLATVGRLAAGVAHEIGNPVAAVLGYLDVLRLRPDAAPAEYLERIERETRRIDRIVRDLVEFARPRPFTVQAVSVTEVVEAAARLVVPQPRWRAMNLVLELPPGLPAIAAEAHYATQVFVNLLINAADAAGGQGTVTISGVYEPEGFVRLEVCDDGPGIPPADLPRVFDPFFTTKAPGEGTGLGLALCHRILEQLGGTIAAGNRAPRGARFTLRFRTAGAA